MSDESVSVVIPTRNRRKLLFSNLRALRCQRVPNLEILVVDDCGSDGTVEMVRSIGDARIRVLRTPRHLGVAGARNMGLDAARGTWVAFSDDDDLWSPQKVERQLSAIRTRPGATWCAVGSVTVDDEFRIRRVHRPPRHEDVAPLVLRANAIPGGGSGVMAKTSLVRDAGGFDEKLSMFADWDLWIRLALRAKLVSVSRFLLLHVRHGENMSLNTSESLDEVRYMEQKYAVERTSYGVPLQSVRTLLWIAQMEGRAGHRLRSAQIFLSLAKEQRSLSSIRGAVFSALGPRAYGIRDNYRSRHLPREAVREGVALVEEVQAAMALEHVNPQAGG